MTRSEQEMMQGDCDAETLREEKAQEKKILMERVQKEGGENGEKNDQ